MEKKAKNLGWHSQTQSCGVLSQNSGFTKYVLGKKKKASVDEFATDGVRYPYISQVIQGELLSCISLRESPVSHSLKKGILSIHKRNCESLPKYRPKTKW